MMVDIGYIRTPNPREKGPVRFTVEFRGVITGEDIANAIIALRDAGFETWPLDRRPGVTAQIRRTGHRPPELGFQGGGHQPTGPGGHPGRPPREE